MPEASYTNSVWNVNKVKPVTKGRRLSRLIPVVAIAALVAGMILGYSYGYASLRDQIWRGNTFSGEVVATLHYSQADLERLDWGAPQGVQVHNGTSSAIVVTKVYDATGVLGEFELLNTVSPQGAQAQGYGAATHRVELHPEVNATYAVLNPGDNALLYFELTDGAPPVTVEYYHTSKEAIFDETPEIKQITLSVP